MADQDPEEMDTEQPIAVPTGDDSKLEDQSSSIKVNPEDLNEEKNNTDSEKPKETSADEVPVKETSEDTEVGDPSKRNTSAKSDSPEKHSEPDQAEVTGEPVNVDKQAEPDTAAENMGKEDEKRVQQDNVEEDSKKPDENSEAVKETNDLEVKESTPPVAVTESAVVTDVTDEKHEVDPHASSPEPLAYDVDNTAICTVKFVLMPSGQVATLACSLGQKLTELKNHFAYELKMPPNVILLMHEGKNMDDEKTLADLGVGANSTIQLELQSADPVNTPIKPYRPREEYHMPDVITVRVQSDEEATNFKDIVVEIERTTRRKPYLGGYRHKETSVEFHHAGTQTMQRARPPPSVPRFCRDSQTVEQVHYGQQTTNDMSTQMTGIGVYVTNMTDKLIAPGKYTTADDHLNMILQKVVIMQKYYRRWLAKRYVARLKADKESRLEYERQEEVRKIKEKEDRIKKEFERRMNPKNKEDFDLLYHALEKWRKEEETRINEELTGAERKAALSMLLDQETQLIAAIGRHKLESDDDNKEKKIQAYLDKAAAPKQWKTGDGKKTEMDTPYTIRAKELRDIYNSINMKYLTQDERLDVLLTLKHTVKEHDCKLTQEIIELIDREADLLMRGVRESNLDGLRKRISTLFLQYIKTPIFNPEAAKLNKVPQDPSTLRKNIYFCPSCNNYLPSTEFSMASNSKNVGKCRQCLKIDNDARSRHDFSIYKNMLKHLRRSEELYNDGSQIAFLLQESDLHYLVENVWNSQSILSAWDDLYDLSMVRWDKNEEWSPWNCIFLTKDEAHSHEKLSSLDEGYGHVFIHKIKQKHTLARNYFSRLPGMAQLVKERANEKQSVSGPKIAGTSLAVQAKSAQAVR